MYKQDTDIVATWLAVKSKKLGYTIDAEACHKTTSTSGRLKGKARKQEKEKEKEKGKAAQTASNPAAKPCYVVKIKDFVPLAEFLVAYTKPIIKVPVALANALDRAIVLRTQRNEYSRQSTSREGKGTQLDSDVTHSYFLRVLERVREVLRPRMTVPPAADPRPKHAKRSFPADSSDAKEEEQISNRFQMLDLEEPSQAFLNAPGIAPQPRVQPLVKSSYEAEVDQSLEEKCMASFCLFEYIGLIRSYIRHIWEEYKHHRLDLISVAVTTNTAICLVRDIEEDFVKRFPGVDGNTGFKETVQTLFQLRCCLRGENPEVRERADDSMNFKIYDLAEEYLVTTWQMMTSLWDSLEPGKVLIYEPIEDREWELDWDNMTPRQKFKEDYYNLMEGLPDLVQIAIKGQAPLSEDEIIRGLRDVAEKETTSIPLWLAFAFKCFLEIQHTMKGEVGRGYEQLKRTAIAMKTSMTETVNLHKSPQLPRWPKDTLSEFNAMYGAIEIWVVQDFVQVQRKTLIKDTGIRHVSHALLKRDPLLCGLFEFALKARF
ncbi:MAG: hypothetical protein Q9208_006316 [Pyrenodesmia sp. 3 TL-2023]